MTWWGRGTGFLVVAGWLARVLVGWRAADDEFGFQAVEDGLEAELEGVLGCRAVVGGGGVEAGAKPWELHGDLAGVRHVVAQQLCGVTAVAAELPGERGHCGWAEGVPSTKVNTAAIAWPARAPVN